MKKVGTVTVHSAISYGAMLQAYALRQTLDDMGYDAEIIDYRNQMIENKNKTFPTRKNATPIRILKDILSAPLRYDRNRRFVTFMNNYMRLTPSTYHSIDELKSVAPEYDAFFTGSDQVWNVKHADFDPVYFLAFADSDNKMNSYAASFGYNELPREYVSEYKKRLARFSNISVRESSAKSIIKNLTDKSAVQSVDPTLLLDAEHWRNIAKKPSTKGYVLLYEVNSASSENYRLACNIARKHNLKVICITQALRSIRDLIAHQTGPEGLLGYIENADYVLTDSFHGTVFSILFNKKFVFCKNKKNDVNIRMDELLKMTKLETRSDSTVYDDEIDWLKVEDRINVQRNLSKQYIEKVLS